MFAAVLFLETAPGEDFARAHAVRLRETFATAAEAQAAAQDAAALEARCVGYVVREVQADTTERAA